MSQVCIEAGAFTSLISQADADAKALAAAQALVVADCPAVVPTCEGGTDPTPPSLVDTTPVSVGTRTTGPVAASFVVDTSLYGAGNPTPPNFKLWDNLPPGQYILNYVSGHNEGDYQSRDGSGHLICEATVRDTVFLVWTDGKHNNNIYDCYPPPGYAGARNQNQFKTCQTSSCIPLTPLCGSTNIEAETLAFNPASTYPINAFQDGFECIGSGGSDIMWGAGFSLFLPSTKVYISGYVNADTPPCVHYTSYGVEVELIRIAGFLDQPPRVRIKNWTTDAKPLLTACSDCTSAEGEDPPQTPNEWDGTFPYLYTGCPGSAPDDYSVIYQITRYSAPHQTFTLNDKILGDSWSPGFFVETSIAYRSDGVNGRWELFIVCRQEGVQDIVIWAGVKTTGTDATGLYPKNTDVTMCSTMLDSVCVEAY